MNAPKISVIIPVYNVEAYLEQCLQSVLKQTLADIEVICVDDGSRDGSRAILERVASDDDRIKLCFHESNKSLFMARKTGVAAACGEYFLFLDSDDYLEPEACEVLYNKITTEAVDILHFSSRVDSDGETTAQIGRISKMISID